MLEFNTENSHIMHVDLNSCFASIEQQANRALRGRPIAVAAYKSPGGCILAPSIEAKKFGIKTGMRVKDGLLLCPDLIVLEPDTEKYRFVHKKMRLVMEKYTPDYVPKSIDEFTLNLSGCPALNAGMFALGVRIKEDIRKDVGDYIKVSIGIAPNRFLAKTAAGLKKPDGLEEINAENFLHVYSGLNIQDLCGIARNNAARLAGVGVNTVLDFYKAPVYLLKQAFCSINGYYWYLRLRGWEIDDFESKRQSFGNSYALPKPLSSAEELSPVLLKLVEKMCFRMHSAGFQAGGVSVYLTYKKGGFWHKSRKFKTLLYESRDIFKEAYKTLVFSPCRDSVHTLAVSCFALFSEDTIQPDLFGSVEKKFNLAKAVDGINQKYGSFVLGPAQLVSAKEAVKDRIAFGGVRELL